METPGTDEPVLLNRFDDLPLRAGVGLYRKPTHERLRYLKQLGVNDVILAAYQHGEFEPALPSNRAWTYKELVNVRNRITEHGLRFYAAENLPIPLYDILTDGPDMSEQLEVIKTTIRNLGRAGVPILGYSGHPPGGVWRSSYTKRIRGGATTSAFYEEDIRNTPLLADRAYSESELWKRYEQFLEAVIPVAEEAGVTLAAHPSDPPIEEIGGVPLILRSRDHFDRALDVRPSRNHGLKLGLGCWSEMNEDIPGIIDHFGEENIVYIHFRDVVGETSAFYETFLDDEESNFDEYEVLEALERIGFSGVVTPDHVPLVEGDEQEFGGQCGRGFTIGYIRGMLKSLRSRE